MNETDVFNDLRPEYAPITGLDCNIFEDCLCIQVVKVNPNTKEIDDNEELNILTQVWLECGEPYIDENNYLQSCHNINYDCGGDTFEEAIIKLANLVKECWI